MTTIPTHNHVIQQSGQAQDTIQHIKAHQPVPDHLAAEQVKIETMQQTTVQLAENSEQVNPDAKNEKQARKRDMAKDKKKKKKLRRYPMPDTPGYLLDTVA